MKGNTKFTFIDLFAGIGGFKKALTKLGGQCLGFSEIDKDAIQYYCENYDINPSQNFGSVKQIETLPEHDLMTAGVPCQSWSIAGRNLGFDDDRGQLWNDTIYLLNQSRPKAFIFENVKGLVDPRNKEALSYILDRVADAGYHAAYHVINSYDYGVPQNRVRIYIIGFREERYFEQFRPIPFQGRKVSLSDILGVSLDHVADQPIETDLFGEVISKRAMSLSTTHGLNDYFLFNDLRNGDTTVHSWDLINTSKRQKDICLLLLRNRRKSRYGKLDGNPLSLTHFRELDPTITQQELDDLASLGILKEEHYSFKVENESADTLGDEESLIMERLKGQMTNVDELKTDWEFKRLKVPVGAMVKRMLEAGHISCTEVRYDFKNTKISTGLNGINRVFLPTSDIFPTLVASDTNDFVTLRTLNAKQADEYKREFIEKVYKTGEYRKLTKEEACMIQGFPNDFKLPENRAKWMKLIGNSVSVPVIESLCQSIAETGVFDQQNSIISAEQAAQMA